MQNPKLNYRPDIDGLRAYAVMLVLIFHAYPKFLTGGFVGVDVFFVISGYLITSILLRDIEDKTFRFKSFYVKRVRRIFPALGVVLACTLLAGWIFLLEDEYKVLGKHVASAVLFSSNLTLWKEAGYFAEQADLTPLLHLWSLGIEEQFYIIWPFALFLVLKFRRHAGVVFFIFFSSSFLLNVLRIHGHASSTFYLPFSRIWEMVIGCYLAYIFYKQPKDRTSSKKKNFASLSGFVMILCTSIVLDKNALFPGFWALAPSLGAFLLIWGGSTTWINSRLLSAKPIVYVGLISYPLYLWHWPLLAFANIIKPMENVPLLNGIILLLSFLFAALTYHGLERRLRLPEQKWITPALLFFLFLIGCFGFSVFHMNGYPARVEAFHKISVAHGEWEFPGKNLIEFEFNQLPFYEQKSNSPKKVLFMGDSNVEQYGPRIDELVSMAPNKFKSVVFSAQGGCPPVPSVFEDTLPLCKGRVEASLLFAQSPEVDTVVIGALWWYLFRPKTPGYKHYYLNGKRKLYLGLNSEGNEKSFLSLEQLIRSLRSSGKNVFLVLNMPVGPALNPKNLVSRSAVGFKFKTNLTNRRELLNLYGSVNERLKHLAQRAGAEIIDPMSFLCNEEFCPAVSPDGDPIYKDGEHLRPTYVRKYVNFLDSTLRL